MEMNAEASTSAEPPHGKQVACLNCRRSKIRCNRKQGDTSCGKCWQANVECIIPDHHIGRRKGVKNKRRGLDKAVHQIEQAIKDSKSGAENEDAKNVISNLQKLLGTDQGQRPTERQSVDVSNGVTRPRSPPSSQEDSADDNLALQDAENPLQLLARASDLQLPPENTKSPVQPSSPSRVTQDQSQSADLGVKSFFVPVKESLDIGPDLDPIDIGLTSLDEAEALFSFFFENLAHTRWGLDRIVHTTSFVRAKSAFLFTSILSASALFVPSAAALSKRLSRHCKFLAQRVIEQRHRSVEIVLAFMVNVPWMAPGECSGDDNTCYFLAAALTVALDLSLNKVVSPSSNFDGTSMSRLARADCIDAKKALHMDGFADVDPGSEWGQRLLRRRERTWIALFVVERGVCLARGRNYTVPQTTLIENCDRWHISDIADPGDGPMSSMAVLRRDLDGLFRGVKSSCDSNRIVDLGFDASQSIKATIEQFYDRWHVAWDPEIGERDCGSLPPYVEILVTHTRLSTYAGVINHPTAPIEVKCFFRAAALSSALNVMRAAIQGESRLKSMPNNTVIMISFAACSALSLSVSPADSRSSLAPSVRNLIEETADVLERIGATPSHRNGASVLYGKFLRELVRRVPATRNFQTESTPQRPANSQTCTSSLGGDGNPVLAMTEQPPSLSDLWPQELNFSAMSDDQIIAAVDRADTAVGPSIPDVPLDDMMNWDWIDFINTAEVP